VADDSRLPTELGDDLDVGPAAAEVDAHALIARNPL
jgi:hypothetical protein